MSWGGASMYVDQETEELLFSREVEYEELIMWREILQKLGKKDKESTETIH
jgi:hypothetical protein